MAAIMALFDVLPVDRAFYKNNLADFLPEKIFDAHTHVYKKRVSALPDAGRTVSWPSRVADRNPIEDMKETASLLFPDKKYIPLMFATIENDGPDMAAANAYVASEGEKNNYPALFFTGPDVAPDELERLVGAGGFRGIKVYLSYAPSYIPADEIRIYDFLTREHLDLANKRGWAVMLHLPRPGRLRDPVNLAQLTEIEKTYKNLWLIVAHAGRAYRDADAGDAFDVLKNTERMLFDISANTNGFIFEKLIRAVGGSRILYGSDLPITRMRMRRIERGGVYVNLVPRGLYGDVSGDMNMGELDGAEADALTFFLYEELEAFRQAAHRTGLKRSDIENIFWNNAAEVFL